MMATKHNEKIVGAWHPCENTLRGRTGVLIVYFTELGTAHAGDLRKTWRVPLETITETRIASEIDAACGSASLPAQGCEPAPPPAEPPRVHPLLMATDKELSEAFERLLSEPSFVSLPLSDWEFKLAANAPNVFLQYGGFTWKQRKYLREIVKKIVK